jgi:hypothetical protein
LIAIAGRPKGGGAQVTEHLSTEAAAADDRIASLEFRIAAMEAANESSGR